MMSTQSMAEYRALNHFESKTRNRSKVTEQNAEQRKARRAVEDILEQRILEDEWGITSEALDSLAFQRNR